MRNTLSEKIVNDLREDIIEGRLDYQVFLTEGDLASRFSTSKAPVRDALHRLCQEGYLISYPRKGYMVNLISEQEYNQIQQVRAHLEQMSVKLAIQNASDEQIESLGDTIAKQPFETNPNKTNNTRFHLRLAEIGGNQYLYTILKSMLGAVSRAVILFAGESLDSGKVFHEEIIQALKNRDEEAAVQALLKDVGYGGISIFRK